MEIFPTNKLTIIWKMKKFQLNKYIINRKISKKYYLKKQYMVAFFVKNINLDTVCAKNRGIQLRNYLNYLTKT